MSGRILALDVGQKRIGVAISDELGMLAHPLTTIQSAGLRKDIAEVLALLEREDCERVVIGLPTRTDGTEGPEAKKIRKFSDGLKHANDSLDVILWDERYTTIEATDRLRESPGVRKRKKSRIDQSAAAVILQSYLDSSGSV